MTTHERPWYRWYVLFILTLIYAFGYIDRQIVTILAPYLKRDMGISDAQLGLLYGTSFALFYCVFGIPLARLADGWSRVRTLALGLSFWSLMTALSGLSRNFVQLGTARIGVGIGEASATPAAVRCSATTSNAHGAVRCSHSILWACMSVPAHRSR